MLLKVQFTQSKNSFTAKFSNFQTATTHGEVDPYTGKYEITPKVDAQTLPTAQKFMTDDVRVFGIPYFETSNASDGKTVYIGTEVEVYGD